MSNTHTPGPLHMTGGDAGDWSATHDGLGVSAYTAIRGEESTMIALAVAESADHTHPLDHLEGNARRLVACWNACIGMSTEEIERDGSLHMVKLKLQLAKDERAELIAQLKTVRFHLVRDDFIGNSRLAGEAVASIDRTLKKVGAEA